VHYGATTAWSPKLLAMTGRTVLGCSPRWVARWGCAKMGNLVHQRSGQSSCGLMGGTEIVSYIREVAMGYCMGLVPSQLVAMRLHCARGYPGDSTRPSGPAQPWRLSAHQPGQARAVLGGGEHTRAKLQHTVGGRIESHSLERSMPGMPQVWLAQPKPALHCNTQDRPEDQSKAAAHACSLSPWQSMHKLRSL